MDNTEQVQISQSQEDQDTKIRYTVCPCCGKPTLPAPVSPNARLLDHWLACLATGVPFSHVYPLYNGKIEVTVTQLTPKDAEKVETMVSLLDTIKASAAVELSGVNVSMMSNAAKICIGIPSIEMHIPGKDLLFKPAECVLQVADELNAVRDSLLAAESGETAVEVLKKAYDKLLSPEYLSAVPVKLLLALVETHNRLYDILLDAGLDQNFWSGIELA